MPTVIVSTTSAATHDFNVQSRFPATVHCKGLAGAETIPLTIKTGSTYSPVVDSDGNAIALTVTKTILQVVGSGDYRLTKGTTAGATEVYVSI